MLHCDKLDRPARADARRRHLLEAARKLFIQQGFHQTGMAQIAAASGIGVGQIYRDFASKEAIIAAIAEEDVTGWLEEDVLAAAVAGGDAAAVRSWIDRFGKAKEPRSECQMLTDILAESGRNGRIAEIYRAVDLRVRTSLTAALNALAPTRSAGEISMLVEFILAAGLGVVARRIVYPEISGEPPGQSIATILERELDRLVG